jgi:hypothetical protein
MTRDERITRDYQARSEGRAKIRRLCEIGLGDGGAAALAIEDALADHGMKLTASQLSVVGAVLYELDLIKREDER